MEPLSGSPGPCGAGHRRAPSPRGDPQRTDPGCLSLRVGRLAWTRRLQWGWRAAARFLKGAQRSPQCHQPKARGEGIALSLSSRLTDSASD